jgi:SAM-dependent methyltransferase
MPAHLDEPPSGSPVAAGAFVVRGWLWLDEVQREIAAVEAWSEEALLGHTCELLERPDVNAFLKLPDGARTGFAIAATRSDNSVGIFPVQLRARLRDGTRTPILAESSLSELAATEDPLGLLRANLPTDALGLEIGAHALPTPGLTPFYTDSVASYAGSEGRADFLADACALPLPDNTLDYLCSSHVLEHLPNPLAALREWHRVLRAEGSLYLVVPDKRYTFDAPRHVTPPAHLLEDFLRDASAEGAAAHVAEFIFQTDWSRLQPNCPPSEWPQHRATLHAHYLAELRRGHGIDIHFHTFTPTSLETTLRAAGLVGARGALFELASQAERYPRERGDGIALLLRKRGRRGSRRPLETHGLAASNPGVASLPLVCPVSLAPLRYLEAADGSRSLVTADGKRHFPFSGPRPSLLPPLGDRPARAWTPGWWRALRHVAATMRLAGLPAADRQSAG